MSINFLKVQISSSNRRGKLVRFVVVWVEYDRSNRVCIRRTGRPNRPSHAVAQGDNFSIGGQAPSASPAGAGADV